MPAFLINFSGKCLHFFFQAQNAPIISCENVEVWLIQDSQTVEAWTEKKALYILFTYFISVFSWYLAKLYVLYYL